MTTQLLFRSKMGEKKEPYWKRKTLEEMTSEEWESLCDGCGICCLEKLEDASTGEIELTSIACEYLDTSNCRCLIYESRIFINSDCRELTPETIEQIAWLPDTCAYRLIAEGKDLEQWHPLVSGNFFTVHKSGVSIRFKAISIQDIHPEDFPGFADAD